MQKHSDVNGYMTLQLGFFFFLNFLLEDNCFTILYWFLSYININQPQVFIYLLPCAPPSHLPPHPTPLGCHRALGVLPVSLSKSSLSVLHMVIYMFQCYSLKSSYPCLLLESKRLFYTSVSFAVSHIVLLLPSF